MSMRTSSRILAAAGLFWFLAGSLFLITEAIAASGFPGYSYAHDFISELGVPYADIMDGRLVRSTHAVVMNGGFIAESLCFALAALSLARAWRGWSPTLILFLLLGGAHAAGLVLIAVVHSGSRELAAGTYHWHALGAGMAILGGNAAILVAARLLRHLGAPRAYIAASVAIALFGLLSLAVLLTGGIVPEGVAERGSVYAIAAWEILSGIVLLGQFVRNPSG
jgi:hypothetical membrane protein